MMKKKFLTCILLFLLFATLGQQIYKLYFVYLQDNFVDLSVYINAARIALAHGNVYEPHVSQIPFNYPPTSLLFFSPLAILPKSITAVIFLFASVTSLLISIWLLTEMLFTKTKRLIAFLLFSAIFMQYFPTKFTLTLGQINLIILLLITTAFYFFKKNKDMHSGIFLGIATLIKIFPCFLILFFIKEKKWKTVFSFIITVGVGIGLTLLFFSPSLIIFYFESVAGNLFLQGGEMSYFDQSLNSFLLRLSVASDVRLLLRIIFTLTSVFLFLIAKNKSLSYFGLIFSVLLFLPSFAWFHHYVILIPLLIILWTTTTQTIDKLFLIFVCLLTTFHLRAPEAFSSSNIFLFSLKFGSLTNSPLSKASSNSCSYSSSTKFLNGSNFFFFIVHKSKIFPFLKKLINSMIS